MAAFNEKATRKERIDRALIKAGWSPMTPYARRVRFEHAAVEEYPTTAGPADYLLFDDGSPIAIVEAKKLAVGPQNVLKQAQRYARGLEHSPYDYNGFRIPFIYSTNGQVIWFQDLRRANSRSRKVAAFHTPQALQELLALDGAAAEVRLRVEAVNHPWLRPYQREAIESIEAALLAGKRETLLAMATGTGKTLTTVALIYCLMKAGYARRVLFLVDRRSLAAQAVTADRVLTVEQEKWLDLIRAPLIENLAIEKEGFELIMFTRAGAS